MKTTSQGPGIGLRLAGSQGVADVVSGEDLACFQLGEPGTDGDHFVGVAEDVEGLEERVVVVGAEQDSTRSPLRVTSNRSWVVTADSIELTGSPGPRPATGWSCTEF